MLPPLKQNQINVFLSQVGNHVDEQLNDLYLSYLSSSELKKYHSFHFNKDRKLYLLAHSMLKYVLSKHINKPIENIVFKRNRYGKPSLRNHSNIKFNLSHSNKAVALVVSHNLEQELGIDIECQDRGGELLNLASHFFSKHEAALLLNKTKEKQVEKFFKLWTLKEAYIKAIGEGLSIDLDSFSFNFLNRNILINHYKKQEKTKRWDFFNTQAFKNYQLSIAVRNNEIDAQTPVIKTFKLIPNISCKDISLNFNQSV